MRLTKPRTIISAIVLLLIGFLIGLSINKIPDIQFKNEIDISTILSILGILITVFILPFIIEALKDKEKNIKTTILGDLNEVCVLIEKIKDIFTEKLSEPKVSEKEYTLIIFYFKQVSTTLEMVRKQSGKRKLLASISRIKNHYFKTAYEKSTNNLKKDQSIDSSDIRVGLTALNNLEQIVRQSRYELFE